MSEYFFIGALCAFFTLVTIIRPNFLWAVLAAVSWMLLFWYSRSNPITGFALGDFGDTAIVVLCWGAASFVLLYTISDSRKKRKEATRQAREHGEMTEGGSREESADEYYDRLKRLTTRDK